MSTDPKTQEENAELLAAVLQRFQEAFPESGHCLVTRCHVVAEVLNADDEQPSICHLSFGSGGEGLPRWQAMGLVRAALIDMEHVYTHDE